MAVANPCFQKDWDEWSGSAAANRRIPWRERMMRWIKVEVREADEQSEDAESLHREAGEEEEGHEEGERREELTGDEVERGGRGASEDEGRDEERRGVGEGEERGNEGETEGNEEEEEGVELERAAELPEERSAEEEEEDEDLQEQNEPHHQVQLDGLMGRNEESGSDEEREDNVSDSVESESEDSDSMVPEDEDQKVERREIEELHEAQEEEPEDGINERSISDVNSAFGDWTSQETDEKQQVGLEKSSYGELTLSESYSMEEEFQDEDLEDEESVDDEDGELSMDEDEDELKIYSRNDYPAIMFLALSEFRDSCLFTDLVLTAADGKSFEVHFLVMAAVSSLVWRNRNQTQGKDSGTRSQSLFVGPEVDGAGLEAIIEFAYTGLISCLNPDNVDQVKTAAQRLGAPRVLDLCTRFLQSAQTEGREKKEKKDDMCAAHQLMISLQFIKQLWMDGVGCDVVLEAVGGSLHVHRVILAVSSDYFRSMFTLGMRESRQQRVTMPLLSASELDVLITCSYSGVLQLGWECVFEVTSTALQLQYQPAFSLCLDFLHQEINPHTCLDVVSFAEAYEVPQILEVANDFILRQFQKVASTSKFKDLPGRQLFRYLSSRSLCVSSELVVFKAIVSWVQAKPRTRLGLTHVLMKTVHFPLMTFKEFKEVRSNSMWSNNKLRPLYESIFEDFCSDETTQQNQCRVYLPKESLVLTGGEQITDDLGRRSISKELWFGNSLRNLTGIRKAMEWRRLGEMPEPARFSHQVALLKGQLYVFGGKKYYGNGDILNSVYRFDLLQNSWESLAGMLEKRSSFSVVVLDGKILAIGGQSDSDFTDSVERYCPATNTWSFSWPLDLPLSGHVAKFLHGRIFVSGGRNSDYPCVASMFHYHPETGSTYLANMASPRAHHCMEILGERLYVAGGVGSQDQADLVDQLACEVYSPAADAWTAIAPLPVPHVGAGSAVLEGKFYVLGGYSQEDYSDTKMVHRFDPATQRWENMGKMPGPNNDICACVLRLPQHFRS